MRQAGFGSSSATVLTMQRPGFLFCLCPDSALLNVLTEETIQRFFPSPEGMEHLVFWGDEGLPARFWEALTLQGFTPVSRILVVRCAHLLPADVWRQLSKALARPNPQAFPVLCMEGAWEKGRPKLPAHVEKLPCTAFARKQRWWIERAGLDERSLSAFVKQTAAKLGLTFTPDALNRLVPMLPLQAAAIEGELLKLSLFIASRTDDAVSRNVEVTDLVAINQAEKFNIFSIIRLFQQGQPLNAWQQAMSERGEDLIFPLLGLLQREARQLWQTLADPSAAPMRRDGEQQLALARRLGITGLAALWDSMHDTELSIKSGKKTPEQALDSLLGEVTLLFNPAKSR